MNNYIRIGALLFILLLSVQSKAQATDSLSHYLATAAQNNLDVQASFNAYQASLQKIPQAGAFEDPTLEIGFFLKPMDIVGGRQVADFTLMQMFPWFGTRKAARSEATHMAKMAYEQFREARDNVFLQVYTQWYQLITLQQQLLNNKQNMALLVQMRELATNRFITSKPSSNYATPSSSSSKSMSNDASQGASSSGSMNMGGMSGMSGGSTPAPTAPSMNMGGGSSMGGMSMGGSSSGSGLSEVIRIEIEMVELESNIETLMLDIASQKALFNTLLNRPSTQALVIPDQLVQVPFEMNQSYLEEIKANNPMLVMYLEEELGYKAMEKMNKKMGLPMIGLGLQYMLINKTNDPMLGMGDMNGDDMFMPMVSVSLPLYRNKYKAKNRESRFLQQAARNKYDSTLNTLESTLIQTQNVLESLNRKISLYQKQATLANTSFELALKEYVAGQTDLSSLIQIHRQILDYKLKEAESIAAYNTQVVAIQKLGSFNFLKQ